MAYRLQLIAALADDARRTPGGSEFFVDELAVTLHCHPAQATTWSGRPAR